MAKRKAARKARAPEPVDETTEEYWDEEESSSTFSSSSEISTSTLSSSSNTPGDDGSSVVSAARGRAQPIRQRRMKTVKPKPLKTLMGNDLSKPRKRKITLLKE